MNENSGLLKRGVLLKRSVELLILGAMAGLLIAGCGGGGGGSGPGGSYGVTQMGGNVVGAYISDSQGPGFTGHWLNTTGLLGYPSAVAYVNTMAASTAPATYTYTPTSKTLNNGVWTTGAAPAAPVYELGPTGWALQTTSYSFVDLGDGTHGNIVSSNGSVTPYAFVGWNLDGTQIACQSSTGSMPCVIPGNYPAGSRHYTWTQTADTYMLTSPAPVTDASGLTLGALPTVGTGVFCDQGFGYIYQPAATLGSYNVFGVIGGCTAAKITTALGTAPMGTVVITLVTANNTAGTTLLTLGNWTGASIVNKPGIYSVRAGAVYGGAVNAAGGSADGWSKVALNAWIVANGFPAIP